MIFGGCPADDEAHEPPPRTLEIPHEYPPYTDEEVGRLSVEIRSLEGELSRAMAEIERLERDMATLEGELKTLERAEEKAQYLTLEATHYTAYCDGCSGVTYSGHDLRQSIYDAEGRRIVAVDPSEIPLGSTLEISYADGTTFEAIASDIGGDIKGKRIDIAVETKDEAYRLGRQDVSVRIIYEGER